MQKINRFCQKYVKLNAVIEKGDSENDSWGKVSQQANDNNRVSMQKCRVAAPVQAKVFKSHCALEHDAQVIHQGTGVQSNESSSQNSERNKIAEPRVCCTDNSCIREHIGAKQSRLVCSDPKIHIVEEVDENKRKDELHEDSSVSSRQSSSASSAGTSESASSNASRPKEEDAELVQPAQNDDQAQEEEEKKIEEEPHVMQQPMPQPQPVLQ